MSENCDFAHFGDIAEISAIRQNPPRSLLRDVWGAPQERAFARLEQLSRSPQIRSLADLGKRPGNAPSRILQSAPKLSRLPRTGAAFSFWLLVGVRGGGAVSHFEDVAGISDRPRTFPEFAIFVICGKKSATYHISKNPPQLERFRRPFPSYHFYGPGEGVRSGSAPSHIPRSAPQLASFARSAPTFAC